MPEGPEVKRIAVQLNSILLGKKITDIQVLSGRYKTHGEPSGLKNFLSHTPQKITKISCKGKFLWFEFSGALEEASMWNTLGMSGSWSTKREEHSRLIFSLDDNSNIFFNDIRNFGTINFSFLKKDLEEKLKSIGPDMLSQPPSDLEFLNIIKKQKKKTLPEVLMNQKVISGVGNYVKAEALYLAKLSPNRTCDSLSEKEILELKKSIDSVLSASYNSGGSTIRTYRDVFGNTGLFTSRFLVYGNDKDPAGNRVERLETKDKRVTHWVPAVQK